MYKIVVMFILPLFLQANNTHDTNSSKQTYEQELKKKNSESQKAIDDFMKKYTKVLGGC